MYYGGMCYFIKLVKDQCKLAAVCLWLIMAENKVYNKNCCVVVSSISILINT